MRSQGYDVRMFLEFAILVKLFFSLESLGVHLSTSSCFCPCPHDDCNR